MTLRVLALLLLGLAAMPLAAVPLWSVEHPDGAGKVLLLGSVHMLRAQDQPLPSEVDAAYRRAGRVVLELHPAELAPSATQAALAKIGFTSPGASIREVLTAAEWQQAETQADQAGLRLEPVATFEPWFATIVLYTSALVAAGFEPALGVDQQIASWAGRDGKPAGGLETLDEQLGLFKGLAAGVQRELFLKTLEELAALEADTAALVTRWRAGDLHALAGHLEEDFRGYEELRARFVTDRNRAWVTAIEPLLEGGETTLVVVGALHLVGPEGLPALLEARGYRVTRSRADRSPRTFTAAR
jgi:uncharacterized protein